MSAPPDGPDGPAEPVEPRRGLGVGRWLLVVLLLALVNVPTLNGVLTDREIARDGEDVLAEVVDAAERSGEYAVVLGFDETVDPTGQRWDKRVTAATYDRAVREGRLEVRAVPGEPGAFAVPGEVGSATGLWMTLLGNVLIAAWVVVALRRSRPVSAGSEEGPAD